MLQQAWLLATTVEGMVLRSWLTTSLSAYRVSVAGLNNSSGRLAIWARRMRRSNSSVLPENMGPQTTSSRPSPAGSPEGAVNWSVACMSRAS